MKNNTRICAQYVICLGALISNLSAGMFNIALLDIAGEYGRAITEAQWVITSYLLAVSVCLPLMGRLGDIKGKQKVHNMGMLLFMGGSVCCALAGSLSSLIGFRVIQGIGAAMYQGTNMALIVSLFPPERRGSALGLTSTFVAAGSMLGPTLGGVMLQWFSWHMSFWLLAGISLTTWILARVYVPMDRPDGEDRLDWIGAGLFACSLTGFITALSMGGSWGWDSPAVITLFAAFALSGAGLVLWVSSSRWMRKREKPFLEIGKLGAQRIRMGIITTIITFMASFSAQLVLPVYLRSVLHVEPIFVGLILLAYPATLMVTAPFSGRLSDRLGSLPMIYTGMTLMIISLTALSFLSGNTRIWYVIVFTLLLGCSMGMINSPNNSLTMGSVPKQDLGWIGSLIAMSRNIGMILGTVAGGSLVSISSSMQTVPRLGGEAITGYRTVFGLTAVLVAVIYTVLIMNSLASKRRASVSGR